MKASIQQYLRGNIEQQIIGKYKNLYPHFEYEQNLRKVPVFPKIVVYSNVASVDKFLEQIFPVYKIQKPSLSTESDEVLTKRIATQLVYPSNKKFVPRGTILQGFPFNTLQAQILDRYLNGVNLAIHVSSNGSGSQEYAELLKYYDERGTLLNLEYQQNLTPEQLDAISREIVDKIKLTEF